MGAVQRYRAGAAVGQGEAQRGLAMEIELLENMAPILGFGVRRPRGPRAC